MIETTGRLDRNLFKELGFRRLLSPKYTIFMFICAAICLVGAALTASIGDYSYCAYFVVLAIAFVAVIPIATSSVTKRQMNLIRETTGNGSIGYHVVADDNGLHIENTDTHGQTTIPYAIVSRAYVLKSSIVLTTNARQMIPMFPSETVSSDEIVDYLIEKGIPVSRL